jgi:class 3 adenylate cyclase
MREQPAGSVTLVFTDIEGSTALLLEFGEEAYRDALTEHRRVVREAFASGYEVDEEGDAFLYALSGPRRRRCEPRGGSWEPSSQRRPRRIPAICFGAQPLLSRSSDGRKTAMSAPRPGGDGEAVDSCGRRARLIMVVARNRCPMVQ